jgi:hypothetical protein
MLNLIASGPKDFCEDILTQWIFDHPLGEFEESRIFKVEPSSVHPESSLPSDTYSGPLSHDFALSGGECPRCVADRAVESALEAK